MSFPLSFPQAVLSTLRVGPWGSFSLVTLPDQMMPSFHSNLKASACPSKPIPASRPHLGRATTVVHEALQSKGQD